MKQLFTSTESIRFSAFWCKVSIFCAIALLFSANTGVSQTWTEDWEGNWFLDWHVDGGTWEVGTPTSGPGTAYNGQNCAATVLTGNYSEPVDTRLIRHTSFVVPAASENPRLRFWYWFSFAAADNGVVQIKTSNGAWESISNIMDNFGSDAWSYGSVDISAYADSTVQIAFNFHSADAGYLGGPDVSSGWYIDDVSLVTGPYVFNNPEDFESGFGDWSVDEGSWEVGIPTSGPSNAHSGQNCVGTNLEGNYQEPADSRLVSPPFVVPAASENPRFRFWYWFSFAAADNGVVQIKTSNGNWESISIIMNNFGSNAWSYGSVDISAYENSTVQIAFNFHSADAGYLGGPDVSSGWYIDDVSLVTGPYVFNNPEDFESGFGDWSVDEGSWEVGVPASGPDSAFAGQNCAGTNLEGNYQEPADSRLVSPPFLVAPLSENPAILFWHWFSFAAADNGVVQIKTSNGAWESISSLFVNTSSGAWTNFFISLSAYADSTVQIAFRFHSADAGNPGGPDVSSGWYVDDVMVLPYIIPVELTSFTVIVDNRNVQLNWTTATETNNQGFEIQRRNEDSEYQKIGYVPGHGTTTEVQIYSYVDSKVASGKYFYRLKQIDFSGQYEYSDEIEIDVAGPLTFALEQNYPNPFNPSTIIHYALPEKSNVELIVYDILGNEIATLVNEEKTAGSYEINFNATNFSSGIYFYRLQANDFTQIKKMILLK